MLKTGFGLQDLHRLKFYEIELLLESQYEDYKNKWEQTRSIVYMTALANSTKKIKPTDVLSFPWDKQEKIDWQEFNRAKEQMLQDLNNNINKARPVTLADLQ